MELKVVVYFLVYNADVRNSQQNKYFNIYPQPPIIFLTFIFIIENIIV